MGGPTVEQHQPRRGANNGLVGLVEWIKRRFLKRKQPFAVVGSEENRRLVSIRSFFTLAQ